ncbi:YceI family protein [Hymenobacter armeniacus]|uniref:YceI family protein n=1 Tax=Hymenobacter armeniacus TaxID=2771358 RepID=A0ABR8JSI8_9BACT|nr:YceI family protein [Hymenobacter armeniacus]MBD2722944.1 YceI family protein [Hymenobacter armeniacus]
MKRSLFLLPLLLLLLAQPHARAQSKFMTKAGRVSFFSASPIEDIEAKNQEVAAVLDFGTGQLAFSLPVKGFVFKRTLMQEHFNENYMESDKFPKATFTGRFVGIDAATLATPGSHTAQVEGDLTLHGVTHRIKVPATVELKGGQLLAAAVFSVAPADYNIEIPLIVRNNIAKIVSVRVALACDPVPAAVGATTRPTN